MSLALISCIPYTDVGSKRSWDLANAFTRVFLDRSDISIFAFLRLLSGHYNVRLLLVLTTYPTIC